MFLVVVPTEAFWFPGGLKANESTPPPMVGHWLTVPIPSLPDTSFSGFRRTYLDPTSGLMFFLY